MAARPKLCFGRLPALVDKPFLKYSTIRFPDKVRRVDEKSLKIDPSVDHIDHINFPKWDEYRNVGHTKIGKPGIDKPPTLEEVITFYKYGQPQFDTNVTDKINGPRSAVDKGMHIHTGLDRIHKEPGPDGVKAVAFAKLDNFDHAREAITVFGTLWLGIKVLENNSRDFWSPKQVWEWVIPENPQFHGLHAVVAGGYNPDGAIKIVTWGQTAVLNKQWWEGHFGGKRLIDEAWVVIWPEHFGKKQFLETVDIKRLAIEYRKLTDRSKCLKL